MTIVTGFDLETTSLLELDERIVEMSARIFDFDSREELENVVLRFNPDKRITTKASAVHGIMLGDVEHLPTLEQDFDKVDRILQMTDIMVAHNGEEFDLKFLQMEMQRIKKPLDVFEKIHLFDTMKSGKWATPHNKFPSLEELCYALDVKHEPSKAHAADYDTDIMMQCFWKGVDLGKFVLPL